MENRPITGSPSEQERLDALMKQANDMKVQMQEAQNEILNLEVVGTDVGADLGSGTPSVKKPMVKITMRGNHRVSKNGIDISPSLLEEDEEEFEKRLEHAINDCANKLEEESKRKMEEMAKKIKIPKDFQEMFQLPDGKGE